MMDTTAVSLDVSEREAFNEAFRYLKSICDNIALNPRQDSSKPLKVALQSLDKNIVQQLQCYLLFPLEVHLFNVQNNSDETKCNLLELLNIVLTHTDITDIKYFLKIYSAIFLQLEDKSNPGGIPHVSEELKLAVVSSATLLFHRATVTVLGELYSSRVYFPKLSLAVSKCVLLARNENFIKLRVKAVECILTVAQLFDEPSLNTIHSQFHKNVADVIMLMVPGIIAACVAIVKGKDIQNHKIIVAALKMWSRIIALVVFDEPVSSSESETSYRLESLPLKSENSLLDFPNRQSIVGKEDVERLISGEKHTPDWIRRTCKRMSISTKTMTELHSHTHWRVRNELVTSVNLILTMAPLNMESSVSALLDTLITLRGDENNQVAAASQDGLDKFAQNCSSSTGKTLMNLVEENFYQLITRLPRILNSTDEVKKESELSLMCGYIQFLGPTNLPRMLNSVQHLHRFISTLLKASTLDTSNISLLEEVSIRDIEDDMPVVENRWKQFKICQTPKLVTKHKELCCAIYDCSDLPSFTVCLLDLFSSDFDHRKEIILLINEIFLSGPPNSLTNHFDLVKSVLVTYMEPSVWYVPVTVDKEGVDSKTIAQENVVQICLLCEGVGKMAVSLGPSLFSPLLLRCLYPLLECAGSPLYMIASAGLKAVKTVAKLYRGGVSHLVAKNVDYLSHHVNLRLRNAHKNPRVLSVLSVIMKNASFSALPSLHEILNDVLVQSCDDHQDLNVAAFLYAFHTFVKCVESWIAKDEKNIVEEPTNVELNIVKEVFEYHKIKVDANRFSSDDEDENDNENLDSIKPEDLENYSGGLHTEKDESMIPEYVKLINAILLRCLHFLPSKDISRQILILQTLNSGVRVLEKWSEQLLPIVHKIWSPLVQRFSVDSHPLLIQRSFALLVTLARTSKDFIRARTLKEVIPFLCYLLKESAKESQLKDEGHAYRYSQMYKLQLLLLEDGLGPLALDMQFLEKDLYILLEASRPYLSSLQPHPLQRGCISMWETIASRNSDIVWLQLVGMSSENVILTPPKEASFQTFNLASSLNSWETLLFKKNVEELLRSF